VPRARQSRALGTTVVAPFGVRTCVRACRSISPSSISDWCNAKLNLIVNAQLRVRACVRTSVRVCMRLSLFRISLLFLPLSSCTRASSLLLPPSLPYRLSRFRSSFVIRAFFYSRYLRPQRPPRQSLASWSLSQVPLRVVD